MGADGDAVIDGSGLQMIQAGAGLQVQVRMFRIGDQQTATFQHPNDAAAESVQRRPGLHLASSR
jgi:hypothetical protein